MLNEEIKKSWEKNALEWIKVIEGGTIESRKFTNPAIVNCILADRPKNVLDLGCGEGWLIRELTRSGISCTGIDASAPLIENAKKKGSQSFLNISYEEIIADKMIPGNPFDAIIFNFSLFLKDETEILLKTLKKNLSPKGSLFIQTLHPAFLIRNSLPHKSQWIDDSWAGLEGNFKEPHHWYIRTFSDWSKVFNSCKFILEYIREPGNSEMQPASVIFKLKAIRSK